jgi:long-subunit fatty acid transport protein
MTVRMRLALSICAAALLLSCHPAGAQLDGLFEVGHVGAGFDLGALYKVTETISLGASYASPSWMGAARADKARVMVPPLGEFKDKMSLAAYSLPGRVSFGASWTPTRKWRLAMEAGYLNYGHSLFGKTRVRGPINSVFYPGFKDIWLISSGADYEFNEHWGASVGYVWNTNPIASGHFVPVYASNTQNMFTCGLRFKKGRWWTGFAYIVGLPALSSGNGQVRSPFLIDYPNSRVRQMLQSFNTGVGFYF